VEILFKSLTYSGLSVVTTNAFVVNSDYLKNDEVLAEYTKNINIGSGRL